MSTNPTAVRILPMNRVVEFPDYDGIEALQQGFFLNDLPWRRDCYYRYRKNGLVADAGTMVLFQCDGAIIASAILKEVKQYARPQNGYTGELQFELPSIKVFEPIRADALRRVWPEFERFRQTKLPLRASKYPQFERTLEQVQYLTKAEQILAAVSRVTKSNRTAAFSRKVIRNEIGVDPEVFVASYGPVFQGMRADQPGGAPLVRLEHQGLFKQITRGWHKLTRKGRRLIGPADTSEARTLAKKASELTKSDYFDPGNAKDERDRRMTEVAQRRGQPKFRRQLLIAYKNQCAITRCDAVDALEAAHIAPYLGPRWNHVPNGLLLRSDIHTLFDLNLIGINPASLRIALSSSLIGSTYKKLSGRRLALPKEVRDAPNKAVLRRRWHEFLFK